MDDSSRHFFTDAAEINVVHYTPPDMTVPLNEYVVGLAAFAVSSLQAHAESERLQKELALTDPTLQVTTLVVESLRRSLPEKSFTAPVSVDSDDKDRRKPNVGSGLVLDIKTLKWGLTEVLGAGYYYVPYQGRARLLRFPEGKVIWQEFCAIEDKDLNNLPAAKVFLENNGALLKAKLGQHASICAERFVSSLLRNVGSEKATPLNIYKRANG
jgi:hypothetical protein